MKGGKVKSESVKQGVLRITLTRAVHKVTVTVSAKGLRESKAMLKAARKKRLKSLKLVVVAQSSTGKRATIHVMTKNLGL